MDIAITVVILLIVAFFLIDGIRRGLVRQLFEIVGLVAAFIAAYYLGHALAHRFEGSTRISYPVVLFFFSALVFIAVVILFHLMGLALQKIVDVTILGPVDRVGGAAFGVLKGVLFVSLLLVILSGVPNAESFRHRLASNRVASVVRPVLPGVYHFIMKRWFPGHVDQGTLVRAPAPRDVA